MCLAHLSFIQINDGVTRLVVKHNLGYSDKHKMEGRSSLQLLITLKGHEENLIKCIPLSFFHSTSDHFHADVATTRTC